MFISAVTRLLRAAVTVLAVFVIVFVAIRLTPGGPAVAMLGQRATEAEVARLNHEMGWDRPIPEQLFRYLGRAVQGDLGIAYLSPGRPKVSKELARLFPATVELTVSALLIAIPVGLMLGTIAAAFRDRWPDRVAIALSSLGVSIPIFFLGILLLLLFPSMPGSGRMDISVSMRGIDRTGFYLIDTLLAGRWNLFQSAARHLVLPAMTLATVPMAIIARVTRSSLLEVLGADYIRTARAKGVNRTRVLLHHALPGAAVPIISLLGLQLATLLAGAVLTETVFTWPGIGRYVMISASQKDYNALQGAVLLLGIVFILVNTITDALCAWFDPRIRRRGGAAE